MAYPMGTSVDPTEKRSSQGAGLTEEDRRELGVSEGSWVNGPDPAVRSRLQGQRDAQLVRALAALAND